MESVDEIKKVLGEKVLVRTKKGTDFCELTAKKQTVFEEVYNFFYR